MTCSRLGECRCRFVCLFLLAVTIALSLGHFCNHHWIDLSFSFSISWFMVWIFWIVGKLCVDFRRPQFGTLAGSMKTVPHEGISCEYTFKALHFLTEPSTPNSWHFQLGVCFESLTFSVGLFLFSFCSSQWDFPFLFWSTLCVVSMFSSNATWITLWCVLEKQNRASVFSLALSNWQMVCPSTQQAIFICSRSLPP